jgi:hypothetical protein
MAMVWPLAAMALPPCEAEVERDLARLQAGASRASTAARSPSTTRPTRPRPTSARWSVKEPFSRAASRHGGDPVRAREICWKVRFNRCSWWSSHPLASNQHVAPT